MSFRVYKMKLAEERRIFITLSRKMKAKPSLCKSLELKVIGGTNQSFDAQFWVEGLCRYNTLMTPLIKFLGPGFIMI